MGTAAPGRGESSDSGAIGETARPDPPRDRILTAASALFARNGIRAVGVDAIIAAAGVAKASFYRHFRSKDELVVAWLRDDRARYLGRVTSETARRATSPSEQLLVFFDVVVELLDDPEFYGCPYLNTAAELRDASDLVRQAVVEYVGEIEAYLAGLAREAGLRQPEVVAAELRLVAAGAFSLTTVFGGDVAPATTARDAATAIVDAAR
jgi:AcrR family transcriptional regulator